MFLLIVLFCFVVLGVYVQLGKERRMLDACVSWCPFTYVIITSVRSPIRQPSHHIQFLNHHGSQWFPIADSRNGAKQFFQHTTTICSNCAVPTANVKAMRAWHCIQRNNAILWIHSRIPWRTHACCCVFSWVVTWHPPESTISSVSFLRTVASGDKPCAVVDTTWL